MVERMGIEKIHQDLISTLGDNACGLSHIRIWLQRFRTGDLSWSDLPHAGRPPLTLGPQVEAFLQKCLFASARIIAKHFLTTTSTVKEILQRKLRMGKFSRRWVPHSLGDAQKIARVEAAKEMLRISQESEINDFDGIAIGGESWFRYPRHPRKCLPVRQKMSFRGRGKQLVRKTMITVFFTANKLIALDVLPRDNTLNQLYFINNIFPDLKTANLIFRRQKTGSTIRMHTHR
jgi:hypothetical protein